MNDSRRDTLTPEEEERLARYLAGELPPEERRAFEQRALDDPALFEAVYGDVALRDAVPIAPPKPELKVVRSRTRPWWLVALPAAAAVLLLVIGVRSFRPGSGETFRGGSRAIELIAPRGEVAAVPQAFRWKPIRGAATYRVEIFDTALRSLLRRTTPTADLDLAPGDLPAVIRSGKWRVVALDSNHVEIGASTYVAFQVTGH